MAKRSNAHTKAQKAGRVRDYETCQACGSTEKVQGHHIFDHQYSGTPSADNIISLCYKCHTNVHNGKMDIFKF